MSKRRGAWFNDGYFQGRQYASYGLGDKDECKALRKANKEDNLGEFAGELRSNQIQMAGDISYDVGHGVTEHQYEMWEEGFFAGYMETVENYFKKRGRC